MTAEYFWTQQNPLYAAINFVSLGHKEADN